jgi:hypothetical protein
LVVGLVLALGWYLYKHSEDLVRVQNLSVWEVVTLSILVFLSHIIGMLKFWLMVRGFKVPISLFDAFVLTESGAILNIVPLNVGSGFRAAYLKQVYRFKFVNFGVGFVGLLFSNLVSAGILGLVFLIVFAGRSESLYALFIALIILPLMLFALARFLPQVSTVGLNKGRIRSWLAKLYSSIIEGIKTVMSKPGVFFFWLGLDLISGLLLGIRYWLIGQYLGYQVDFNSAIVMQSVSRLTAFFTFMPSGALGIREVLTGFGSVGLGDSVVSGVMISTMDRVIVMVYLMIVGGISLFIARRKIARSIELYGAGQKDVNHHMR